MQSNTPFSLPKSSALLGVYQFETGKLVASENLPDSDDHLGDANATLEIWKKAQGLSDTQMLVVKSRDRVSLAMLHGGLVIEGRSKLNIGLVRTAAKHLDPVKLQIASATHLASEDRFRRAFWTIMQRLNGAVIPRVFRFDFAGSVGTIAVQDGSFAFDGDFKTPQDFIAGLQASCAGDEDVRYTLDELDKPHDGPVFALSDLIRTVIPMGDASNYVFDAEGFPLSCGETGTFETMQTLSLLAKSLYERDQGQCDTNAVVFGSENKVSVNATVVPDGTIHIITG